MMEGYVGRVYVGGDKAEQDRARQLLSMEAKTELTIRHAEANLVQEGDACPSCHENRIDWLAWDDDEKVTCASCGTVYVP